MNSKLRVAALTAIAPILLGLLVACSSTVPLTAAKDATNPKCADVIVRLPSAVDSLPIRQTDAQATSAWGNPSAVLLRCGVTPPGPTTDICYTVKGVDWLRDTSKAPTYIFTTYGRNPAVQVVIDAKKTNGAGTIVLDELSNAVGSIKQTSKCLSREDVLGTGGVQTATPTPTPTPSASPTK
jgi:hypothetical protein